MLHLKANLLMKRNVDALLRARSQTRRELARWCRRSDAWIAKIMADDQREFPMKYFDRIADFFGISVYQLFQPGISPLTERRKLTDRRTGRDRRISARNRSLPTTPIRNLEITADDEALLAELRTLTHDEYRRVRHWVQITKLGRNNGQAPAAPADQPAVDAPRSAPARRTRAAARK